MTGGRPPSSCHRASPRRAPPGATLYIGHGGPTSLELLDWQRGYIETFLAAVRAADFARPEEAKAEVVARVKNYLPSDELQFLMELSIEPAAEGPGDAI